MEEDEPPPLHPRPSLSCKNVKEISFSFVYVTSQCCSSYKQIDSDILQPNIFSKSYFLMGRQI